MVLALQLQVRQFPDPNERKQKVGSAQPFIVSLCQWCVDTAEATREPLKLEKQQKKTEKRLIMGFCFPSEKNNPQNYSLFSVVPRAYYLSPRKKVDVVFSCI